MADFEKVFDIRFNTSDAERGVLRIERLSERVERQLKNLNQLSRAQGVSLGGSAAERKTKQLATNLGVVSDRSLRLRAQVEKAFASFEGGANKASKRVGAVSQATERTRSAYLRAAEAGKHLDQVMKKATRDGAAGMRKVERAAKGTERAVKNTDEVYSRFMRRRGEREKAKALAAVERRIRRIGSSSRLATTSVSGLLAKMALLVGVASKIRDVGREFFDFDSRITTAAAKFSAMDKSMEPGREGFAKLRKEVREAARETEHSAGAVAGAVDFWAKAGKTAEQTRAVIPMTLDFASANTDAAGAALDMARAGDILSDVLGQFKMNAKDPAILMENVARVADVMSAAANSANFSADELFESFKGAGPVLKSIGSDIEETSSLLAAMANAGIKGSQAGTQLKMSISNLIAMTGPQEESLRKIGVTVKDEKGEFRGLTTIIRDLNEATKDMGKADRFQVFAKAVGRRAIPSFINLLAEGKVNLDAMTQKLREAGGETKRLSAIIRQSAQKQMQTFWNKVSDLGFAVIEKTKLFERLGKVIDGLDWEKASRVVETKVVPALMKAGKIIANVLVPAIGNAANYLEAIFAPALWLIEKLFGKVSEQGDGMARVLGALITAWVSYRVAVLAATAINIVQYFASMIKGATGAATAQRGLAASMNTTTASMGKASVAAGGLGKALSTIGILLATWEVANIIQKTLIDPIYEAKLAAQDLQNQLDEAKAAQGRGQGSKRTKGYWEEAIENANKQLSADRKRIDEIARMGDTERVLYGGEAVEINARIKSNEQLIRNAENSIAVARQKKNVQKYGNVEDADFTPNMPGVKSSKPAGASSPMKKAAPISAPDISDDLLLGYTGQSRQLTQKIEIGGHTLNINAPGADAKEVGRIVEKRLRDHDREISDALHDAARNQGATEY